MKKSHLVWEGISFILMKTIPRCCRVVFAPHGLCTSMGSHWRFGKERFDSQHRYFGQVPRRGPPSLAQDPSRHSAARAGSALQEVCPVRGVAFDPLLQCGCSTPSLLRHTWGRDAFSWRSMWGFHHCIYCLCSFMPHPLLWACFAFASVLFGCVK